MHNARYFFFAAFFGFLTSLRIPVPFAIKFDDELCNEYSMVGGFS